jgi:protein involved in polysaccharide export with SLBB domain
VLSGEADLTLKDSDQIFIFNNNTLKQNPYIYVEGDALNKPIKIQYYKGLTLQDLFNTVVFKTESEKDIKIDDKTDKTDKKVRYRVKPDKSYIKIDRQSASKREVFVVNLMESDKLFELEPFDAVSIYDYYTTHPLKTISIAGEVSIADVYPFSEGMTFKDLIDLSGGLTEKAYRDSFELTRFKIVNGERVREIEKFNLDTLYNSDFKLEPYDEIKIFTIPKWSKQRVVELKGQFKFPGTYTIEPGEKLADTIARAGGFTDEAFINGAVFTRESLKEQQSQEMKKSISKLKQKAMYNTNSGEQFGELAQKKQNLLDFTNQLAAEAEKYVPIGRITINLDHEKYTSKFSNIVLQDKDSVYVPVYNDTIFISGQVLNQITAIYNPSLSLSDYINQAGGVDEMADTDSIYVVRANGAAIRAGSGFFMSSSVNIEPGDTIIVPMKLDFISGWQMIKDATQVLYQIGLSTAAWVAISKN